MIRVMQPVRYSEPTGDVVYIGDELHSVHMITDGSDQFIEWNFHPIESLLKFTSINQAIELYKK